MTSSSIKVENLEIEDKIVLKAILEIIKDKAVLNSLKKSIFSEIEVLDIRAEN